jgi:hypothetical protein
MKMEKLICYRAITRYRSPPWKGKRRFITPVSFATKEAPYTIIANEFNNDGHLDVLPAQSLIVKE